MNTPHIQQFDSMIEKLKRTFPNLEITENLDAPVERAYDLKKQNNLQVAVHLNLQNEDEFHLNIGDNFWCEWFPCDRESVATDYYDSVEGFLDGRHRLVDFFRGEKCYKSQLQKNVDGKWQPIANSMHASGLNWPWATKHTLIITNSEQSSGGNA